MKKVAIIIGAGPAGLTAAYELLKRTNITPIILEKSNDIGGISKTTNYKGNRIDLGGHCFFSKSTRVMEWWANIMPISSSAGNPSTISYQNKSTNIVSRSNSNLDSDKEDLVMLVRNRLSRIYFLRKFFTYPIQLTLDTLNKLGLIRTFRILFSYLIARIFPKWPECTLEDFFINRFGSTLYLLFFKDYTEKVWGVECKNISAEWGAQRIKGINITKAIQHAIKSIKSKSSSSDIQQKNTETSLIERFLYPKYGPGQLWEEVARQIQEMGGVIHLNLSVDKVLTKKNINGSVSIQSVIAKNMLDNDRQVFVGDYFFSTMPIKELISDLDAEVPQDVLTVAEGLQYRDFLTVGILLDKLVSPDNINSDVKILPDTWIYIQERDVKVGRLQIFNNWSPYMVKDPNTVWIGMEYFCNVTDDLWRKSDEDIKELAISELVRMGLANLENVLDSTVLRMEKTYPAYFGTYNEFYKVRDYVDSFQNLFLVGRNGMHKYNNSDHSMLTAMVSVDNICCGITSKENIWSINTEQEYHEEKSASKVENPYVNSDRLDPRISMQSFNIQSFKGFLFNKYNKLFWIICAIILPTQFFCFRHYYPQASYINGDSYVYLETAYFNRVLNTYPIGYPKFLRLFSVFSTSDTVLVASQYLMLEFSSLFLLITIFYFYRPSKFVQYGLLLINILNPFYFFLGNSILSDAVFIPLSLTWFSILIWIYNRPSSRLIFYQAIILFLAFTVRYNALYYPILGSVVLCLTPMPWKLKLWGVVGSFALIITFIGFTSYRYKELTGKVEFSPFSGWQMANNAMYAYRYVDSSTRINVPYKYVSLDKMVRNYFDTSMRNISRNPQEMLTASTVYMWDPHSPLQQYKESLFNHDTISSSLKKWATVGPLYYDYGKWIITHYPGYFIQYYLWPNAVKYYTPPIEFLDKYNMGKDSVLDIARVWFHYPDRKLKYHLKSYDINILNFYPYLIGTLNGVYLISILMYFVVAGYRKDKSVNAIILLSFLLWIFNFSFSVFASPIALRFQVYPSLVVMVVSVMVIEIIAKEAFPVRESELKLSFT